MKGNKRRKKKRSFGQQQPKKKKKEFQRSATRQTLLLLFCLCGSFELGERRKKRNGTSEVKRWHLFFFFFSVLEKQVTPCCCCCCCCFCACVFVCVCLAIFLKAVFFFFFSQFSVYMKSTLDRSSFFRGTYCVESPVFFFFFFGDAYWQQWSLLFQRIMLSPSPSFISFLLFPSLTYFRFSPTVLHTAISSTVSPPLA